MPRAHIPSRPERLCAYAVLAALALCAFWLLKSQPKLNPAVTAYLEEKNAKGLAQTESPLAGFIPKLEAFPAQAGIEAFDPDTLSDKIDGKAELYLAAGFSQMACQAFGLDASGKAGRFEAYVYEMNSPDAAFAALSGQRRAGSKGLGLGDTGYLTENAVFFQKGKYYVELVADRAADSVIASLEGFGRAMLRLFPGDEAKAGQGPEFPAEGLSEGSTRLSLSDAFGLDWLDNVYTAEYKFASGEATAFKTQRKSPDEAKDLAAKYAKYLEESGFKPREATGLPAGARLMAMEDAAFEVVMLNGQTLLGVHDATSQEAALNLANLLAKAR